MATFDLPNLTFCDLLGLPQAAVTSESLMDRCLPLVLSFAFLQMFYSLTFTECLFILGPH